MKLHARLGIALLLFVASPAAAQEQTTVETPTAAVPVAATPAQPSGANAPQQTIEERITFLLSGYEYFPTREDLDAVGKAEEVSAVLRRITGDENLRPSMRLRAADALGYYQDEATVALLTNLAKDAPKSDLPRRKLRTAVLMRHHAITALAKSQREAAVLLLEELGADGDVQIALSAVHALAKHGGKPGLEAMARLKDVTTQDVVRRELTKWVK